MMSYTTLVRNPCRLFILFFGCRSQIAKETKTIMKTQPFSVSLGVDTWEAYCSLLRPACWGLWRLLSILHTSQITILSSLRACLILLVFSSRTRRRPHRISHHRLEEALTTATALVLQPLVSGIVRPERGRPLQFVSKTMSFSILNLSFLLRKQMNVLVFSSRRTYSQQ
jgi:hypothetical protein